MVKPGLGWAGLMYPRLTYLKVRQFLMGSVPVDLRGRNGVVGQRAAGRYRGAGLGISTAAAGMVGQDEASEGQG